MAYNLFANLNKISVFEMCVARLDHLSVNIHACIYADGNVCKFLLIQLEFAVGKIEQFVKLFNSGNFKNTEVNSVII